MTARSAHSTFLHLMENVMNVNMTSQRIAIQIQNLDGKFRHAFRQVVLLNERVNDAQACYDRSVTEDQSSFRYCLRMRLMAQEGVCNNFYEYATRCSASMNEFHLL